MLLAAVFADPGDVALDDEEVVELFLPASVLVTTLYMGMRRQPTEGKEYSRPGPLHLQLPQQRRQKLRRLALPLRAHDLLVREIRAPIITRRDRVIERGGRAARKVRLGPVVPVGVEEGLQRARHAGPGFDLAFVMRGG